MKQAFTISSLLFICFFLSSNASAQKVSGLVRNEEGKGLEFVNIYVEGAERGTISNRKGFYQLNVPNGKQILVFSAVGYEKHTVEIVAIAGNNISYNLRMQRSTTQLPVVDVKSPRDLAREIMDKARQTRKVHRDLATQHQYKVYRKSSVVRILKDSISRLAEPDSTRKKSDSLQPIYRQSILLEQVELVKKDGNRSATSILAEKDHSRNYRRSSGRSFSISVDIGEEEIAPIPRNSSYPYLLYKPDQQEALDLYKNELNLFGLYDKPIPSPLSSSSALAYKFLYRGKEDRAGRSCYLIECQSRFKGEPGYDGFIWLSDSSYQLVYAELSLNPYVLKMAKTYSLELNYSLNGKLYAFPTEVNINYDINESDRVYRGNISEQRSELNQDPVFPAGTFSANLKEYHPEALNQPDSFWTPQRSSSLSEMEKNYVRKRDSLKSYYQSDEYFAKIDSDFNKLSWWTPLIGYGHRNRARGTEWFIYGILGQVVPFGIGGYRHKLPGYYNIDRKNGQLIEIDGFLDYGFRNQDIKGRIGLGYTYLPRKAVRTYVRVGDFYEMINSYASVEQTFSRSNYARVKTLEVNQRMEIINGLYGQLGFEYSDRIPITNIQLSRWSDQLFQDLNDPIEFARYTKLELRLELLYRLGQKFYFRGDRKIAIPSNLPTLRFIYRQGIPDIANSEVRFNYLELEAWDDHHTAKFGNTRWRASIGGFANTNNLRVLEYKFFRGSDRFFFSDPLRSLQLLGPTFNTPNAFVKAHAIHHFNGSILGKIPLINLSRVQLTTGAALLSIPQSDFHQVELYGGLERAIRIKDEIFRLGLYAVTSDSNLGTANFRIKLGVSFFNGFTQKWDY